MKGLLIFGFILWLFGKVSKDSSSYNSLGNHNLSNNTDIWAQSKPKVFNDEWSVEVKIYYDKSMNSYTRKNIIVHANTSWEARAIAENMGYEVVNTPFKVM